MTKAIDVADYLILLSNVGNEPDPLTPLRLQKLLYYVQRWALDEFDRPIFDDPIEAWALGPVVPIVFDKFKQYQLTTISLDIGDINLTDDEVNLIARVWENYKEFSPTGLSRIIRDEKPWVEARKGLSGVEACHKIIRCKAIKADVRVEEKSEDDDLIQRIDDGIESIKKRIDSSRESLIETLKGLI